ncbi:MAG: SUF system NifU family Fe-S cluster assembly protein [Bacilli bacterium]|nr:SUF system NifU family Fe-S cluster assembly protein [Bacilli bacterium]
MSTTLSNEMIKQIMLDHYQNPTYKKKISDRQNYIVLHARSHNCIDNIHIYLKTNNNIIQQCFWDGEACVITASSTDIMCGLVINKTKKEACQIIEEYFKMIEEKKFKEDILQEAIVFVNVSKQLARVKCATIGFNALYNMIKSEAEKNNA